VGEAILLSRRLILMGTGAFAVPSFAAALADSRNEIVAVVTKPIFNDSATKGAKNNASSNKPLPNPVLAWAQENALRIITPASINSDESVEWLRQESVDLLFVCDYGQILSRDALSTAKRGGINLHGSLLPRHRGAAPVQWSILRGDAVTGVSVIHMTPKLDGGPIISQSKTTIPPRQTAHELETELSLSGVACTLQAIDAIFANDDPTFAVAAAAIQDPTLVTPAPRLAKSDGQIDCRYEATLIDRQFRGLQPWPGLYGNMIDDQRRSTRVIIGAANPLPCSSDSLPQGEQDYGRLLWGDQACQALGASTWKSMESDGVKQSQLLVIICKNGFLRIDKIQPAGKRMLTSGEFLAGYGKNKSLHLESPTADACHPLLEKLLR
jgi:methionyl-tRNA formyltransferase